jgi:hypothetical protein
LDGEKCSGTDFFPNNSPDLNIIENIWSSLKHAVAFNPPRSEMALIKSLQKNCDKLTTPENLNVYFESLHTRFHECIEEEGEDFVINASLYDG